MIHESSIIEAGAVIGENVTIGPFCYIKGCVTIQDNCQIASHVVIGSEPQSVKEGGNPDGRVIIGEGTTVREFATIHQPCRDETIIGKNCLIMANTIVSHDCIVGDNVILTSCSGLSGYCRIGDGTIISALCHIHQFAEIGRYCMIGSSTYFKGTSPDGLVWISKGKVAIPLKVNVVGLDRHNPLDKEAIIRTARLFIEEHNAQHN